VFKFTADAIDAAPQKPGVFIFFDDHGSVIRIGSCLKSIQSALVDHWKGLEGAETCGAAFVGFEEAANPLVREAELNAKHVELFGCMPRTGIA
jgi:hypothetical protein